MKPNKSSETIWKPKVLSSSIPQLHSSSPKVCCDNYLREGLSSVKPVQPLSGHNKYEFSEKPTSATSSPSYGSQSKSQTSSMKPIKSSEALQKPKVISSATLKPDSSSPKLPCYNYLQEGQSSVQPAQTLFGHNAPTQYESSEKPTFATGFSNLGSQSNPQTTSMKPNKSSEVIQKSKVLSPSILQPDISSPKPLRYSSKPTLSRAPYNPTMDQKKSNYIWVSKGTTPTFTVPEDVEALINKDILPSALIKPLSPSTYKDYFRALLYAEDCYIGKWDGFEMENVTLELEDAALYRKKGRDRNWNKTNLEEEDDKVFVTFEMDSEPQNRPFLLSRDFVYVRPSGSRCEPFKGIIYRVVRSNRVLVEFEDDFHSQHIQGCKYNVKFSFNRICLKRAHQAIDSASDTLFKNFLFPASICSSEITTLPSQSSYMDGKLDTKQPLYLFDGPLCLTITKKLSTTGILIREAIIQTYRTKPDTRILICAPTNATCDEIVKSLQNDIPESAIFRANAAFRERDEVPSDILQSCRISGDCFSCPSLKELEKFKVISSSYMSCFRLHSEGLVAGHFSHMFMLNASSTTEPEALVALTHFAHESTNVVVTGTRGDSSRWIRSPMARMNGLMKSYFQRLYESEIV